MRVKTLLSVFDLDHTLFKENSSFLFCLYLFKVKQVSLATLIYAFFCRLQFALGWLSLKDLHEKSFDVFLSGRSLALLESYIAGFVEGLSLSSFYEPAIACLRHAQKEGQCVLLLSSSPTFLVAAIAQKLGIQYARGTEYLINTEGKLSGIAEIMQAEAKADYLLQFSLERGISRKEITAYSDSHLDLPLLFAAGKAVAVNPDRVLVRFAKKHQWSVI